MYDAAGDFQRWQPALGPVRAERRSRASILSLAKAASFKSRPSVVRTRSSLVLTTLPTAGCHLWKSPASVFFSLD